MLNELGVLLKYEFRYYFRFLPFLYLALIVLALVARFNVNLTGFERPVLLVLLLVICMCLIYAMIIITIVCIIQRFLNNLLKDQGGLMLTLPVSIWTLVASKAIAALGMVLMSLASVFISALFFTKEMGEMITTQLSQAVTMPIPNSGEIMLIVFLVCATIVQKTCLIYLAITVSHLLPRFRFAAGFAIYLAVSYLLEQKVFQFAGKNMLNTFDTEQISITGFVFANDFYLSLIPLGIAALAFAALYFWLTGFLIKRTFNME